MMFSNGYALVIGIANYPCVRKLPATVLKDAQDVKRILCSPSHCGYPEDNVKLLLDSEATAEGIRNGLRWLSQVSDAGDTAVLFFSGHGGRSKNNDEMVNYLIPYDGDPNNLGDTAISGGELTNLLRAIEAQRLLAFFDSCYSGGTGDAKDFELIGFKSGLSEEYYGHLAQGTGRVIVASSRSDEVSLVLGDMNNSLFTHYLLEALQGGVRTRADGLIRVFDLFDYVSEKVPTRGKQHPIFKAADLENNFPIALYAGGRQFAHSSPRGDQLHIMCDRGSQAAQFDLFFRRNLGPPQVYLLHGEAGQCHDSFIERLKINRIKPYAAAKKGELEGAVHEMKPPIHPLKNLEDAKESFKINIFEDIAADYDYAHTSVKELVSHPKLKHYPFIIIQHNFFVEEWGKRLELLVDWYLNTYWMEHTPGEFKAQFLVFLNFIYPRSDQPLSSRFLPWRRFDKSAFVEFLRNLSVTVTKARPCLLFEELNHPERKEVCRTLNELGIHDDVECPEVLEDLFRKKRNKVRMIDIERCVKTLYPAPPFGTGQKM